MPPGAMPLLTSLYSDDFDGSPSNASRKRPRKRLRAVSSSGNSRAGSIRISGTGYSVRWVSASKVLMLSMSSPKRSSRYGSVLPIGNRSMSPPRIEYSPGDTTCVTWL